MTLVESLESLLPPGTDRRFGELKIKRLKNGSFFACHRMDAADLSDLTAIESVSELRELAKFDEAGNYRPLKTAPGLRCGWQTTSEDAESFLKKLDAIYPGAFANWVAYDQRKQDPVSFRETLSRQSGMNQSAASISDSMANRIMRDTCARGCLRQIAWPIDERCAVSRIKSPRRVIPLICTEACTFAVSAATEMVKDK